MSTYPPCPKCKSEYTYELDQIMVCPDCAYEWNPNEVVEEETESLDGFIVKDSNGTILANGDTVVVVKNIPVKGNYQGIKAGTKVKNIKLVDSDHNIDCKIDGFGGMMLKSELVKKA
jgi:protein PhnA